jgi:hypothetical protein
MRRSPGRAWCSRAGLRDRGAGLRTAIERDLPLSLRIERTRRRSRTCGIVGDLSRGTKEKKLRKPIAENSVEAYNYKPSINGGFDEYRSSYQLQLSGEPNSRP